MTPIDTTEVRDKYRIVFDKQDAKKWCVELLPSAAPFNGILYTYGEFCIKPGEDENSVPKFSFQTEIIYAPDHLRDVVLSDEESDAIEILLGKILVDIVETHAGKAKNVDGKLFLEIADDDK